MKTLIRSSNSTAPVKVMKFIAMACVVLGSLFSPQAAHAIGPICRVAAGAAAGGDGSTWAKAFNSLQSALGNPACTEIWVRRGVYKPGGTRAATFQVPAGVKVYGGFAGTETYRSQRKPAAYVTILSGDIAGDDINTDGNHIDETYSDIRGNNNFHVVTMDGMLVSVTSMTVLDGFTITGGQATDPNGLAASGGGLQCIGYNTTYGCSPTLSNLVFSGNAALLGGAIMNDGSNGRSSPAVINSVFRGNYADALGGAIYNHGGSGGTSSPTLSNVSFTANISAYDAGAIFDDGDGGTSSPTLRNVTFASNHTTWVGGAIYNDARSNGASSPSLINVTFYGNSADQGGAMYNYTQSYGTSSPQLKNVTFYGNSATTSGGAMHNVTHTGTSNPTLTNVILWNDTSPNGSEIWNVSAYPNISYSDVKGWCSSIGGATCGTGNINADPRLYPLGNYGGFAQSMPLKVGSPAIDHGSNTGCPSADERGIARPQDGDGDTVPMCDMGATESRRPTMSFDSIGAQDGVVLESGENTSVGGSLNSTNPTFALGDDGANRQYRAILSFDTAALPDTGTPVAGYLDILKSTGVGANPFNTLGDIKVDIRKGSFNGNAALELADFQATPSLGGVASMPGTPVGAGWYISILGKPAFVYINRTGITQFRLRFALDDNNNSSPNYLVFYSGEVSSGFRPILILQYYLP